MSDPRVFHETSDGDGDAVLHAIVRALARADGCEPAELDLSLNEYTDTDALKRFIDETADSGYVTFNVDDSRVLVFATGDVVVHA